MNDQSRPIEPPGERHAAEDRRRGAGARFPGSHCRPSARGRASGQGDGRRKRSGGTGDAGRANRPGAADPRRPKGQRSGPGRRRAPRAPVHRHDADPAVRQPVARVPAPRDARGGAGDPAVGRRHRGALRRGRAGEQQAPGAARPARARPGVPLVQGRRRRRDLHRDQRRLRARRRGGQAGGADRPQPPVGRRRLLPRGREADHHAGGPRAADPPGRPGVPGVQPGPGASQSRRPRRARGSGARARHQARAHRRADPPRAQPFRLRDPRRRAGTRCGDGPRARLRRRDLPGAAAEPAVHPRRQAAARRLRRAGLSGTGGEAARQPVRKGRRHFAEGHGGGDGGEGLPDLPERLRPGLEIRSTRGFPWRSSRTAARSRRASASSRTRLSRCRRANRAAGSAG